MLKKLLKIAVIALGAVVLLAAAAIGTLTALEYRPAPQQPAEIVTPVQQAQPAAQSLTLYTWNIGYAGLGKDSDFVMDGGSMVNPPSQQVVEANLSAITDFMRSHPADAWLVQELDINSVRTGGINQYASVQSALGFSGAFAYNYRCAFVPFPVPPIGRVQSGLATFTAAAMQPDATRVALHCPFDWPVRVANLKRCLLVTRTPVAGTDRELVLINLHLEAYESGEGRAAQTRELVTLLEAEYAKGNYVIAGGDFNQNFPGAEDFYPLQPDCAWHPGQLEESDLSAGWRYAADLDGSTCRLLNAPYTPSAQQFVIDGFILSPNVELLSVETVPLHFEHSDHNPVRLQVNLL